MESERHGRALPHPCRQRQADPGTNAVPRHPDRQLWRYGFKEKSKNTFRVLPRRWVMERTLAWLGQSRRLCRDYDWPPQTSETMIYAAMSRIMLKRLARSTA
jgi:transposase